MNKRRDIMQFRKAGYVRCIDDEMAPRIKTGQICKLVGTHNKDGVYSLVLGGLPELSRFNLYSPNDFVPATKKEFEKQELLEALK